MRPSIRKMRDTYDAYMRARQERYDELTSEFDGDPTSSSAMDVHDAAVDRMDLELQACEYESTDKIYISVGHYIIGDELFAASWDGTPDKKLFDLS